MTDDPSQDAIAHIYENVGFDVEDTRESTGYIYENVGFNVEDTLESYGHIYEEVLESIPMRSRIGIPI